jgi:site-specific DNA recombinase
VRTAVYTRISQDVTGQQLGVQRQLGDCVALAERIGWEVVARYDDNDVSAYSGKRRPGFDQMLDDMKAGQFAALIVWHTDRLYRSMKDLERLIDVADASGVQLKTVQGGDLDLSTSAGRMLGRILGATARQESEHHAERRKAANLQRAAAGQWCATGNRPYGYTKDGEPLEPEASLLRQAAVDILAGHSLHSIAAAWNSKGYTTTKGAKWSNLHVRRVLTNPRIAALRVHQGRIVGAGSWEPILELDTFRGLTAYLQDPSRKNGLAFERRYMLSGIARCGLCDQPMYATYPHGRGRRMVYACRPTAHIARSGALLDEYVEALVLAWFSQPKTRKRLAALLNGGRNVDVKALQAQHEALQARKRELAAKFAKGAIDGDQLDSGTSELNVQQAAIAKVLGAVSRKSPAAKMLAAEAPRQYWAGCSPDIRGKIVAEIMTVTVKPAPRGRWFKDRDEPTTAEWERFGEYLDIKPKAASNE